MLGLCQIETRQLLIERPFRLHIKPAVIHEAPPVFRALFLRESHWRRIITAISVRLTEKLNQPTPIFIFGDVLWHPVDLAEIPQSAREPVLIGNYHSVNNLRAGDSYLHPVLIQRENIGVKVHAVVPDDRRPAGENFLQRSPKIFGHRPGCYIPDTSRLIIHRVAPKQDFSRRVFRVAVSPSADRALAVGFQV